jgi:hypothetical protein
LQINRPAGCARPGWLRARRERDRRHRPLVAARSTLVRP